MKLNTKTFQWHAKMPSIFDEHRSIMQVSGSSQKILGLKSSDAQGKTNEYQKALKLKRERFQEELDGFSSQV